MEESLQPFDRENKEIKIKKLKRIILLISILVIIGLIVLIVVLVTNKNDEDSNKETIPQPEPEPTDELAEYDQLCLLLQISSFAGKEANSFSPRAEPNETLREDGVFVKTDINFGNTFPNSYLDIYYPGPIEEDRPTYIYWHGGGHIFGDKNLGDPLSPNSDTSMHMFDYIYKQGFNFISVNYCFAPKYRYPAQIIQYD